MNADTSLIRLRDRNQATSVDTTVGKRRKSTNVAWSNMWTKTNKPPERP